MVDRRTVRTLASTVVLVVSACNATINPSQPLSSAAPSSTGSVVAAAAGGSAPAATAAPTLPPTGTSQPTATESLTETIDHANFSDPTAIDNAWFPLRPGTKLVHAGSGKVDGKRVPHSVVMVVTDMTKVIDGIRAVVINELDYDRGDLVEAEIAFFAQDDDGNVWQLGQDPEEYEDGELVATPVWIAGQREAKAGISIKGEPHIGGPSYSQGWGPEVSWTDRARVFEVGSRTCVPIGCYDDVLVTDEFNRDEPDAHQLKYYARNLGVVRVGWAGAMEEEQEVLELVEIDHLDADGLAKVRADVLAMEKRAYTYSKDVYGQTPPMERSSDH